MTDHLLLEQDGAVAVVTFNRPEARNAMTFEMYEALHDACERLDRDPGVRAVVLRGAGDRSFASGTDIDRKSTRLNSSHDQISYAVFCLKKKNNRSPPAPVASALPCNGASSCAPSTSR